jgi:subtilase-type serine protease
MSNSLTLLPKSRMLQSISVLTVASIAAIGGAQAGPANTSPSSVNVLNLLSPFLGLNATPTGQTTLIDNLNQAISINNNATPAQQQLSISDENLLSSASNTLLTGPATKFGVAVNLGGGLPNQPAPMGGTVSGSQAVGGLGANLGAIYDTGVNGFAAGTSTALTNTVGLLTGAYNNLTSPNLGAAKNYFANGTTIGATPAVAPAGFTLPTAKGLPNRRTASTTSPMG